MADQNDALEQIDAVISWAEPLLREEAEPAGRGRIRRLSGAASHEIVASCMSCTERVAGRESVYYNQMEAAIKTYSGPPSSEVLGILRALRRDVESGYVENLRETVRSDYGADILSYAESLLLENGNGPITAAAVLAGGVLEEHIRNLCDKYGIGTERQSRRGVERKNLDAMNSELRKARVYGKIDQTSITAWYHIRSHAAHAEYDKYDENHVRSMIMGLRTFIATYPA